VGDLAGKAWNAPNTAIGLAHGLAGHVASELNRLQPVRGKGWHDEPNWNERGPQSNPARPWARKIER
jgi:hypothetical protein